MHKDKWCILSASGGLLVNMGRNEIIEIYMEILILYSLWLGFCFLVCLVGWFGYGFGCFLGFCLLVWFGLVLCILFIKSQA